MRCGLAPFDNAFDSPIRIEIDNDGALGSGHELAGPDCVIAPGHLRARVTVGVGESRRKDHHLRVHRIDKTRCRRSAAAVVRRNQKIRTELRGVVVQQALFCRRFRLRRTVSADR